MQMLIANNGEKVWFKSENSNFFKFKFDMELPVRGKWCAWKVVCMYVCAHVYRLGVRTCVDMCGIHSLLTSEGMDNGCSLSERP